MAKKPGSNNSNNPAQKITASKPRPTSSLSVDDIIDREAEKVLQRLKVRLLNGPNAAELLMDNNGKISDTGCFDWVIHMHMLGLALVMKDRKTKQQVENAVETYCNRISFMDINSPAAGKIIHEAASEQGPITADVLAENAERNRVTADEFIQLAEEHNGPDVPDRFDGLLTGNLVLFAAQEIWYACAGTIFEFVQSQFKDATAAVQFARRNKTINAVATRNNKNPDYVSLVSREFVHMANSFMEKQVQGPPPP